MSKKSSLLVYVQAFSDALHPISQNVVETAIALAEEQGLEAVGVVCTNALTESLRIVLLHSGLSRVLVLLHNDFCGFVPEAEAHCLAELAKEAKIFLFPATPEGRTLSAMVAAYCETGVTADCTALSFREDGLLLQTRPAFSGNVLASIVTAHTRPQIASLRFKTDRIRKLSAKTKLEEIKITPQKHSFLEVKWLDQIDALQSVGDFIIAIGNGIQEKAEVELFQALAKAYGAALFSSRALVDRGLMPRSRQIGLSGQSVSPKLLWTFGISGSLQFCAGLDKVSTLCSVNTDANAPLLKRADVPLVCDMFTLVNALLEKKA